MPIEHAGPVILAAFANDHSNAAHFLRNLSVEAERIRAALEPAHQLCPLVLLPSATLEGILDAFQTYRDRVVVFHYAGHANGFELLLESASGGVHRVGAQGLAAFLGQQQGLELVFLNGCSTEQQAEDLLNAGVGCVIATTQSIDDAVATDFSARFYKGIVTGAPLQAAYAEATGSAQASSGGSIDRLIRRKDDVAERPPSRWPWLLKFKPGAERVAQWSLPEAAGDPLFGLPAVPQRDLPESPYRHLYRFEEQHAEVFFGRGQEIRELYQRVTAIDAAPVVQFYGPSGVGKSSLLDAGLIPRLAGKNEVCYCRRDPLKGLGETLRAALPEEFRQLSRCDGWIAAEKQLGRPLVIVLDQIEEVFTKPIASDPDELKEFVQLLRRIFYSPTHRPQGKLILGFRKEWFAEIDELLADAQVPRSRIFLERLSRDGALKAITGPIDDLRLSTKYKLTIEDGLPEVIADDLLADPDTPVAPTLQILLTRMWAEAVRQNPDQPRFDVTLYQSLHRDGILLDDFLRLQTEQIKSRLPQAVNSGFLLDLLESHTTTIGTSAEHPLSRLESMYVEQAKSGLLAQTLKLCEELYLLTFSGTAGGLTLESSGPLSPAIDQTSGTDLKTGERARVRGTTSSTLAHGAETQRSSRLLHDTLAPLIRARHEESDLPGQRARRILDNRLVDWLDGKTGIPLDAKDLKEVESALEGTRSWSPDEQRLVSASREQRASNRRWSRIFKGLGVAAVVLIVVAAGVAYVQRGEAISQKAEADRKTILARQETDKALLAQAKADAAASQARREQARSERTLAITARDQERHGIKAAHYFAASAALVAVDDPQQSTQMRFAASQSISGLTLVSKSWGRGETHSAWVLDQGGIGAQRVSPGKTGSDPCYVNIEYTGKRVDSNMGTVVLDGSFQGSRYSPNMERGVFFSQLAIEARDRFISKQQASLGDARISEQTDVVVTWGPKGASVIVNPWESEAVPLVLKPVEVARVSESGSRILTWSPGDVPVLWTRPTEASQQWTNRLLLDVGTTSFDHRLSPEFIEDEENLVVWSTEVPASGSPVVHAWHYSPDGQLLLHVQCETPLDGRCGWTSVSGAGSVRPGGKPGQGFYLWDSASQKIWAWRLSPPSQGTVEASVTVTPNPVGVGHSIRGLAATSNGLIAVWTDEESSQLRMGTMRQFTESTTMDFSLGERIQEAAFSPDGEKILAWTANVVSPIGLSPVGLGENPPGSIYFWDTQRGLPVSAPLKAPKPLRGVRWAPEGRSFVLWGEELIAQHWRLTDRPHRHEIIQWSSEPTLPPAPEDSVSIPPVDETADKSYRLYVQGNKVGIAYSPEKGGGIRTISRDLPVKGIRFVGTGTTVLEWGGKPGEGYVSVWDVDRPDELKERISLPEPADSADIDLKQKRLLVTTIPNNHTAVRAVTVHLWSLDTRTELMLPLKVHTVSEARFCSSQDAIAFPIGDHAEQYHRGPVLPFKRRDPRWDVIERTGTFLDSTGTLTYLTPPELKDLRRILAEDEADWPLVEDWIKQVQEQRNSVPKDSL